MAYQKRESDYSPAHPELKIVPIRAMRIGIFHGARCGLSKFSIAFPNYTRQIPAPRLRDVA